MVFYKRISIPTFGKVFNSRKNETKGKIKNEAEFILQSKNIA